MSTLATIHDNDVILAKDRYYSLDCYQTKLNNNVLVVGAAGAGKTRSIVTPNLLQAYGSYIVSDPKGNLYHKYSAYLREKGYRVELLDFDKPENSTCRYNFFRYIRCEKDILKVAHMLSYGGMVNKTDPFWDRSAEVLLTCIISFLWKYRPESEQSLEYILKMLECFQMSEANPDAKSPFELVMEEVEKKDPHSFTFKQYSKFRVGAIRTLQSVLITLTSKLGQWDIAEVNELLADDTLELARLGHQKTAVFVVVSDTDRSMDDLANLFYMQAMNELCYEADSHCEDSKLPVDVRFILDDFATNCKIGEFPRMISGMRSRGLSVMLMIQAESQLEQSYGRDSSTIIGNCDTYIYLGGNDIQTAENVAKRCDLPLSKVLYMPVETNWIFRRGQAPAFGRNFELEEYLKFKKVQVPTKKYRYQKVACVDFMPEY